MEYYLISNVYEGFARLGAGVLASLVSIVDLLYTIIVCGEGEDKLWLTSRDNEFIK